MAKRSGFSMFRQSNGSHSTEPPKKATPQKFSPLRERISLSKADSEYKAAQRRTKAAGQKVDKLLNERDKYDRGMPKYDAAVRAANAAYKEYEDAQTHEVNARDAVAKLAIASQRGSDTRTGQPATTTSTKIGSVPPARTFGLNQEIAARTTNLAGARSVSEATARDNAYTGFGKSSIAASGTPGPGGEGSASIKTGDVVGYSRALSPGDADRRMVVLEDRGDRVAIGVHESDPLHAKTSKMLHNGGHQVVAKSELKKMSGGGGDQPRVPAGEPDGGQWTKA